MFKSFPHYFRIFRQVYVKQKSDTLLTYLKAFYWSVRLEKGGTFVGLPKFRRVPGSYITIGRNVRILSSFSSNFHGLNRRSMITTLSKKAKINIGNNVGMSGVIIVSAESITIGDRVLIGASTTISDTDSHALNYQYRHPKHFGFSDKNFIEPVITKEVIIEEDVFIGMNSLILKGAHIGSGSVIGAGSIVTGYIPSNVIAAGQPAKVIKKINGKT